MSSFFIKLYSNSKERLLIISYSLVWLYMISNFCEKKLLHAFVCNLQFLHFDKIFCTSHNPNPVCPCFVVYPSLKMEGISTVPAQELLISMKSELLSEFSLIDNSTNFFSLSAAASIALSNNIPSILQKSQIFILVIFNLHVTVMLKDTFFMSE